MKFVNGLVVTKLTFRINVALTFCINIGPLRNCSTLRFESKHSYFKRIVAATKNYVNSCFTLAMNHLRLQACLLESGLFPSEVQLHSLINPIFSNGILSALSMQGFQSASCIFQRWSPRGRSWPQGRPRGHILKSLALASRPQVLENWPVLGSRTALFFELLKFCGALEKFLRNVFSWRSLEKFL